MRLPTRLFLTSTGVAAAALATVALIAGPARLSAGADGRPDSLGFALAAGLLVAAGSASRSPDPPRRGSVGGPGR